MMKLLNIILKKEKDLYIYYCYIKSLLKKMYRRDPVINSSK